MICFLFQNDNVDNIDASFSQRRTGKPETNSYFETAGDSLMQC